MSKETRQRIVEWDLTRRAVGTGKVMARRVGVLHETLESVIYVERRRRERRAMLNKCTWSNCKKHATQPQVGQDGRRWANLCDEHATRLKEELAFDDVRRTVKAWVDAQGGPEATAVSM